MKEAENILSNDLYWIGLYEYNSPKTILKEEVATVVSWLHLSPLFLFARKKVAVVR